MNEIFNRFSGSVSWGLGHPIAFLTAAALTLLWAVLGPITNYSTAWLYSLSLTSGILTFLMTFVIVNAQNRNSLAAQIKLDELIRAVSGASNAMINLENMNDEQLAELREKLAKLADEARQETEAIEQIKDRG